MKAFWSRVLGLCLLSCLLASCATDEKLTALIVVVDSDIKMLDSVSLDVAGFGQQPLTGAELGPGKAPLPRRLGLVHRGGPLGPITITAKALRNGAVVVVKRQARVYFVQDKTMMLRLNLLSQCIDFPCPSGETCGDMGCRSTEVMTNELTEWSGTVPPLMPVDFRDAGSGTPDGGPEPDASVLDAGADTGVSADSGPDANMSMIDAGPAEPPVCAKHRGNCDSNDKNGCETNLLTSADHCNACGTPCPAIGSKNIVLRACMAGMCQIGCDNIMHGNCDGLLSTGCETDLQTTLAHCGGCNLACPSAGTLDIVTSDCVAGGCAITCDNVNHGDCDTLASTGCETDLQTTLAHCGGCNLACPSAGTLDIVTSDCVAGGCAITCDNVNHGDCDTLASTGCETDLQTTLAHCGGCNLACPSAGTLGIVTSDCVAGGCTITCDNVNHGDCDTLASTGCETDLQTTLAHCGGCNQACPSAGTLDIVTSDCVAGGCAITCDNVNHADCDTLVSTGCETDLQTTFSHCGACNAACPAAGAQHIATSACVSAGCAITCDVGWADFDGVAATGCETPSPLFAYTPSNFDPAAPELGLASRAAPTINCAVAFDTGTTGAVATQNWCGVTVTPFATTQTGGAAVVVVPLSALTITSAGTLTLTGQRPVIFAVFGDVSIAGRIDASASGSVAGAGGNVSCSTSAGGAGGGGGGNGGGGGGGGGFATAGAVGGVGGHIPTTPVAGTAGVLRSTAALSPLIAGCPGGKGGDGDVASGGGGAGGGGGAFQLSATGSVSLGATAVLAASGGGGRASASQESGGGGGGSGGAILLEGSTVVASAGAWLTANGGGGAEGSSTSSNNGVSGANGAATSATAAAGGSGGESNGGNGGNGGVQGVTPKVGGAGTTVCGICGDGNDNGGGGGGGSTGRIHVRASVSCTLSTASMSPAATQTLACN